MSLPARILWLSAGVLLGLFTVVSYPATPAAAHAYLISSDPASGSTVPDPPTQVVLTFSEAVQLIPDRLVVVSPDGEAIRGGEPSVDGAVLTVPLPASATTRGTYLVSYRVISADGHPVGGSITYSVGAPSEPPEAPAGPTTGGTDPVVATAVSTNKYLGYAGLTLVIGAAVMLARLWPQRLGRTGATRLAWVGIGLVTASTLLGLWLQAPYQSGGTLGSAGFADVRQVLASDFGTAHVVRLGVLVAVALLLRPVLAGRATRSDLVLLVGLAVVGLGTWPFAGHAVTSPVPAVSVVADTLHLAAAALWLGGLLILAGFLLRLADAQELSEILPEWSRYAAWAVGVLVVASLALSVLEIGAPEALLTTRYGWLLLAKVGLLVVVVAVAGYSRRLVRDRIAPSRPRALRTAVLIESVVLAVVVGVAAVLVQTTPGRTEIAIAEAAEFATDDFTTTLQHELFALQVRVEPAARGSNTIHLFAVSPEGQPQPVAEWEATASLPAQEVEPISIPMLPLTDNHAIGEVMLHTGGEWEFTFTLRVSDIDQGSIGVTVPIR